MYAKQKEYKIADSNIALLGSDLEKKVKLASAETEKAWEGVGKAPGLHIWRIEKFKVVPVDRKTYGQFYSGDSYILINTYKKPDTDKLLHDIHFWLGASTTQDEAGTAAYKTVELDTLLGGVPVQHREIEEHESELFLSYFASKGGIRILEGGIDSGFNHVKPVEYKPRLLHLKGKKYVRITQVPLARSSLNGGDVFILDNGLKIYQWNGAKAGGAEKARASQLARALDDERGGKPTVTVFSQGDKDAKEFWALLEGGEGDVAASDGTSDEKWQEVKDKKLFVLTDKDGKEEFKKVQEGKIEKKNLKSEDAFIVDVGAEVFVWIGSKASVSEKAKALKYAQSYLASEKRPNWTPITRLLEHGETENFLRHFDDHK
jgi:gelsolin